MNTEQAEKLLAVASSLGLLIELKSNFRILLIYIIFLFK